jgi:hypothetical protein
MCQVQARGVDGFPLAELLPPFQLPQAGGNLLGGGTLLRVVLPAVSNELPQLLGPIRGDGPPVPPCHLYIGASHLTRLVSSKKTCSVTILSFHKAARPLPAAISNYMLFGGRMQRQLNNIIKRVIGGIQ